MTGPRDRMALRLLTIVLAATVIGGCGKARPLVPAAAAGPAPEVAALQRELAALLDRPGLRRATWGIAVRSLRMGERLFERTPHALLVPASAMKVVTAAVAGAAVGWDFTFTTTVELAGTLDGGTLNGDLVLRGSGDPATLGEGGTDLAGAVRDALNERGITRIAGRVIGDDNLVEEPRPGLAWSWDDLGTTSGAVSGALNATENVTRIVVKPGPAPGQPSTVEPPVDDPGMLIVNHSTTGAAGTPQTLWAERRPGEAGLAIEGSLPHEARPVFLTVSVGNPTLWTARLVRSRLIAAGVVVDGDAADADDLPDAPTTGERLVTVLSRPLADVVTPMLKRSINMYAEALLRLATGREGARERQAAVAATRRYLREWGVSEDAARMVDGSALSRWNLMSAETLVAVLAHERDGANASPLLASLPVAGVDGTLAERMKGTPAAGNVRAKTGAMNGVRSLAGYVTTQDGEPLAFAVVVNNYEGAASVAVAAIDALAVRLAGFSRR